jgi:hypothetical protein
MHEVMIGARVDGRGNSLFFGWDEVNSLLRHGMTVKALEPGDVFEGKLEEGDTEENRTVAWYFKVLLDDTGIAD